MRSVREDEAGAVLYHQNSQEPLRNRRVVTLAVNLNQFGGFQTGGAAEDLGRFGVGVSVSA